MCTAFDLSDWADIVDISISCDGRGTVVVAGWHKSGTVMITGTNKDGDIPFDESWKDVVQVLANNGCVYGVRKYGTVLRTGYYQQDPYKEDLTNWTNISQLVASNSHIYGITQNGRVLHELVDSESSYDGYYDTSDWYGVVKLVPGYFGDTLLGITYDGRVYTHGMDPYNAESLSGVADLFTQPGLSLAVQKSGKVIFVPEPDNFTPEQRARWDCAKQLVSSPGTGIAAILRTDGTVVCTVANEFCDNWTEIVQLYCAGNMYVGLKENGKLITHGGFDLYSLTDTGKQRLDPGQSSGEWRNNLLTADPLKVVCSRKGAIYSVTFLNSTQNAPDNAYSLGKGSSARVLGWAEWNNGMADVYIAADGGINGELACANLFQGCGRLVEINFNGAFHTDEAESMQSMFRDCVRLEELDLSGWNTSNVKSMNAMFAGCSGLKKLDLSPFDTSSVTNMASMFSGCTNLESVDVGHFDTSKVVNMEAMFRWCNALREVDVSKWNVSRVQKHAGFMNDGMTINGKPWKEFFRG